MNFCNVQESLDNEWHSKHQVLKSADHATSRWSYAYFCFCFCFCLFCFVLLSLEAIEAYKLHKLWEWTKSVGGKGDSTWKGMKIRLFGETTQRNHLRTSHYANWLSEINNEIRRGAK